MRKRFFTLLLVVTFFISAAIAQTNSLLWEISGNGLAKPSYLYGTMHVSSKIAFHLTDSFFIALKSVDVIALESNPETWIENDYGDNQNGDNPYDYDDYYTYSDFYSKATKIEIPDTKAYNGAFADNSWLINGYLYRYNDYHGDYEEDTYLDLFIFQCGKKLGKDIASLEHEQEVLKLLQKAYGPTEDEEEKEDYIEQRKLMDDLYEDGTSVYEQIDEAYRTGDLDKLDSLEHLTSPSKHYHKYFIDDRNANMVRRMDSIMQSGRTIFTGIGAAHLPGEYGAIKLLRQMGYSVHPVKGKITGKSIKEKNRIDDINYLHGSSLQFAKDSLFSLQSPGKLYNIMQDGDGELYLYPDMANSAYYQVVRISHRGGIKNQSEQDILDNLDNILFENIPGDIISKTKIVSNSGLPGLDIISKTKRGNVLRFKIFVSPIETIIFKAGGIGDFVTASKEAQSFFNSIQFKKRSGETWNTYTPSWGLFSLDLPEEKVIHAMPKGSSPGMSEQICSGEAAGDNGFYWFSVYFYNDDAFIEKDSFELQQMTKMFSEQFKKNKYEQTDSAFITVNGHPGLTTVSKGKNDYLFTKTVISGPYYIFLASVKKDDQVPEAFFSSLQLKELTYDQEFATYTDTSLYFTVETIVPKADTILSFDDINYYNDYNYYGYEKDKEDLSYLSDSKSMLFSSEATPENIFISYSRCHKFYSEDNRDTFWKNAERKAVLFSGMNISRKEFTIRGSVQELSYLLTDTASTRGIYHKLILKDNVLFHLSTCIDTTQNISSFIKTFYSTFAPSDSVQGRSVFESPSALYFSQLNSEDSVLRKQAINSIHIMHFTDADADSLIRFIGTPAFKKLKLNDRESFIAELGMHHNAHTTEALKSIYIAAGDTSTLQLAVLDALASQKTEESLKAFLELLYIETPLAKKNTSLSWIFSSYTDTIQLAQKLFPGLYDFTSLPEYQYPVYKLLAFISKADSTKASLVLAHKKQIMSEATAELKRTLAGNEVENRYYSYYSSTSNNFPKLKNLTSGHRYRQYDDDYFDDYGYSDYGFGGSYNDYSNRYSSYLDIEELMAEKGEKMEKSFAWAANLLDYYTILMTEFYDDPAVKKYFDKILKSKDHSLIYRTSLTMMASDIAVPDTVWTNLLKNREWRYFTISNLQKYNYKHKLDSAYTTQLEITEGCLYPYTYKNAEDSVQFLTKRMINTKSGAGYIYFYKSKFKNDKGWNLDCIGVQPADSSTFEIEPMFVDYGGLILDDEDLEEKIDDIIHAVEMIGHDRVYVKSSGNDYNYQYLNDY